MDGRKGERERERERLCWPRVVRGQILNIDCARVPPRFVVRRRQSAPPMCFALFLYFFRARVTGQLRVFLFVSLSLSLSLPFLPFILIYLKTRWR